MAENFKDNRAKKDFSRQQTYKRKGMPRVLIVTEGEVTEVEYFTDLCRGLGLTPITVEHPAEGICIAGEQCDSAPISVFKYAEKAFLKKEPKEKGVPQKYYWDEIYCVFDRDTHGTYHEALRRIAELQQKHPKRKFEAITSHRCFEIWFLLHFQLTSTDFANANALGKELKKINDSGNKIFENYEHGSVGIFKRIQPRICTAKANAHLLNKQASRNSTSELGFYELPHTLVVKLVERIEAISELQRNLGRPIPVKP